MGTDRRCPPFNEACSITNSSGNIDGNCRAVVYTKGDEIKSGVVKVLTVSLDSVFVG
jgi:hypothetical protein